MKEKQHSLQHALTQTAQMRAALKKPRWFRGGIMRAAVCVCTQQLFGATHALAQ